MTIDEYKEKFLELFKQLEKEHGKVQSVEIEKIELSPDVTRGVIRITF